MYASMHVYRSYKAVFTFHQHFDLTGRQQVPAPIALSMLFSTLYFINRCPRPSPCPCCSVCCISSTGARAHRVVYAVQYVVFHQQVPAPIALSMLFNMLYFINRCPRSSRCLCCSVCCISSRGARAHRLVYAVQYVVFHHCPGTVCD
jgi:hypothetical protein